MAAGILFLPKRPPIRRVPLAMPVLGFVPGRAALAEPVVRGANKPEALAEPVAPSGAAETSAARRAKTASSPALMGNRSIVMGISGEHRSQVAVILLLFEALGLIPAVTWTGRVPRIDHVQAPSDHQRDRRRQADTANTAAMPSSPPIMNPHAHTFSGSVCQNSSGPSPSQRKRSITTPADQPRMPPTNPATIVATVTRRHRIAPLPSLGSRGQSVIEAARDSCSSTSMPSTSAPSPATARTPH